MDVDRIRADNEARVDAERKGGLIINTGRECCCCCGGVQPAAAVPGLRLQERGPARFAWHAGLLVGLGRCIQLCTQLLPVPSCSQPDQADEGQAQGGVASQVGGSHALHAVLPP